MKPVQSFNELRDKLELAALEYEAARQRAIPHFLEKAECDLVFARADISAFYVSACMLKEEIIPALNDAADALERVKATAKARAIRNILKGFQ